MQTNENGTKNEKYGGSDAVLIDIAKICLNAGTQLRTKLDNFQVERYSEIYKDGGPWSMTPIHLCFDGERYIPSNGYHRITAAKAAGLTQIAAFIKRASLDECMFDACAANKENTVARCRDTVQRAVRAALGFKPEWSDRKLAEWVGVHFNTIYIWRHKLEAEAREAAQATKKPNEGGQPGQPDESNSDAETPRRKILTRNGQVRTAPGPKKKTPAVSTPPKEMIGALQPDLRDIFADPTLNDLAKSFRVLVREIVAADPLAVVMSFRRTHPWIDPKSIDQYVGEATRSLTAIAEQIESNLPSVVCPDCQGEGSSSGNCPSCTPEGHTKSIGYLPAWRHVELLRERRLSGEGV